MSFEFIKIIFRPLAFAPYLSLFSFNFLLPFPPSLSPIAQRLSPVLYYPSAEKNGKIPFTFVFFNIRDVVDVKEIVKPASFQNISDLLLFFVRHNNKQIR
jgi:hypothetical protein